MILKPQKLLSNVSPSDTCTHVGTCALVIFPISSSAPLETELQLYLSSINQQIHWQLYSLLLPVTVFSPGHCPWGFLPITPFLREAILKSLISVKVQQLAVSAAAGIWCRIVGKISRNAINAWGNGLGH